MSNAILIIGESGAGKSTSIEELNPKETFINNVTGKDLPIKGFKKNYTPFTRENVKGNYLISSDTSTIIKAMQYVSDNRPDIKTFITDDFQYIMSFEFMARSKEKGYDKFNDIGGNAFNILQKAKSLREDLTVIILTHSIKETDGFIKMKTIGKMLDDKITPEGLFTTVLYAEMVKGDDDKIQHIFRVHSDGNSVIKSPKGMFESDTIPNSLKHVLEKVNEYNN